MVERDTGGKTARRRLIKTIVRNDPSRVSCCTVNAVMCRVSKIVVDVAITDRVTVTEDCRGADAIDGTVWWVRRKCIANVAVLKCVLSIANGCPWRS